MARRADRDGFARRALAAAALGLALAAGAAGPAGAQTIADVAGTWEGVWNNTTFGSSGAARLRVEIDGPTATIGFDLGGNVFGGFDPPEVVCTAPVGSGAITQADSFYGDVSCTGSPADFDCTGDMISPSIVSATLAGGIAGEALATTYTVSILGFGVANGTLDATRLPEPAAGAAAAALAALAALACARRAGA